MALLKIIRLALASVALLGLAVLVTPARAQQQPAEVNPIANAVKEDQLLNQMRIINGRGTIPDVKSYNLEQPAGRDWWHFHQVVLPWIGGIAILGMLVLLVLFYLIRGMVKIEAGRSGRRKRHEPVVSQGGGSGQPDQPSPQGDPRDPTPESIPSHGRVRLRGSQGLPPPPPHQGHRDQN